MRITVPDNSPSDPEVLRQVMMAAGTRLIEHQKAELRLSRLYRESEDPRLLEQWRTARRTVEELAQEYLCAIREYRSCRPMPLGDAAELRRNTRISHSPNY